MHGYLRHLANFAYIVEAGSLSAAAKTLDSTPSAMSESVRILEAHLGSPLLERHQRGVSPTPLGERIHSRSQQIVEALQQALDPGEQQAIKGTLRISVPGELAQNGLELGFLALKERLSEAQLEIYVEDSVLDYSKFTRDLYVRASHLAEHSGLTTLSQARTRVVLVGEAKLFQAGEDENRDTWAKQTLLRGSPKREAPTLNLFDQTKGEPVKTQFSGAIVVSDAASRLQAVRAGLGVMVCLAAAVEDDLQEGSLVEAGRLFAGPEAYITVGSPHKKPPAVMIELAELLIGPFQPSAA